MSLERFTNIDDFLIGPDQVHSVVPNKWTDELTKGGKLLRYPVNPDYMERSFGLADRAIEAHIYSAEEGNYVTSVYNVNAFLDLQDRATTALRLNTLNIPTQELVSRLPALNGNYLMILNLHRTWVGTESDPAFKIEEISPDRTELYLRGFTDYSLYSQIEEADQLFESAGFLESIDAGNVVLNFGTNNVYTILEVQRWTDADGIIVKLLKPISDDLVEQSLSWIELEEADPALAYLNFIVTAQDNRVFLRPANFEASGEFNTVTETDFANYTQLLGSTTQTSEEIIQNMLSGSFGSSPIGIDYSAFENFVFYASAAERVKNFKYKLEQIEFYDEQINLLHVSASVVPTLQSDLELARVRKNAIIGAFDGFENWLYNEPTQSLFTHQALYTKEHNDGNPTSLEGGVLAAKFYQIQPWPKIISSSNGIAKYSVKGTSTTEGQNWYSGTLASASLYDTLNEKSLANAIPEHIRLDSNNDQYELFVNMIGQHFDIMYSYADALAKTYHPLEHPKLGHSKDTLYHIAQSLGWKLVNGKQASALWQYKLGYNESGSFASTGSIFTKSDEAITTEVWRRIVNNLPYLLKTKGTARGIKALMNTYGIPQTLLSIREYGGPKVGEDVPQLIEDRFTYALQFKSGSVDGTVSPYIEYTTRDHESDIGTWGFQREYLSSGDDIPVQTREFRFKPAVKESMLLLSGIQHQNGNQTDTRVNFQVAVQYTGSYSGSDKYGRVVVSHARGSGSGIGTPITASTDYVPLYDGNFWNLRWFWTATGSDAGIYNITNNLNTTYHIQVQHASDHIDDKIIHQTSASYTPTNNTHKNGYGALSSNSSHRKIRIGGHPGLGSSKDNRQVNAFLRKFIENDNTISTDNSTTPNLMTFSGSMQEYREWLEDIGQTAFDLHTKNPTSYVSGLDPTSSFDTLVRHYPLGTELNAVDHSLHQYQILSSSHPAQSVIDSQLPIDTTDTASLVNSGSSYATMSNFPTATNVQRGNYEPVEETYYIQGASLGASLPKSNKIRFDDNSLITSLSPTATAETSTFDNASLDSNRLGLFYSMADQINKDIFNQIGDVALDDYVGDPDDQYEYQYKDLNNFANNYWKKYSDKNDVNAFMRIFAQFDFALFESIKQMIPDRANEALGLLVEPHILERVKVVPFKKPQQSSHHYDGEVKGLTPTASADFKKLEGEFTASPSMTGDTAFHADAGSNSYNDVGNYRGDIILNTSASTDYFTKQIFEAPISSSAQYTAKLKHLYQVATTNIPNENGFHHKPSEDHSWTILNSRSRQTYITNIQSNTGIASGEVIAKFETTNRLRLMYDTYVQTDQLIDVKVGAGVNIPGGDSNIELDYLARLVYDKENKIEGGAALFASGSIKPVTHLSATKNNIIKESFGDAAQQNVEFHFEDVHLPKRTNLIVEVFLRNASGVEITENTVINRISTVITQKKVGYNPTDDFIDIARPSVIFKKKTLHYGQLDATKSKRFNGNQKIVSESLHRGLFTQLDDALSNPSKFVYSQSLDETCYRDDENNQSETKYGGSRISAPGVNVLSGYSELSFEPIVEVFITNPNQIVYNSTPQVTERGQENPGNLTVTAGKATITNRPPKPTRRSTRSF